MKKAKAIAAAAALIIIAALMFTACGGKYAKLPISTEPGEGAAGEERDFSEVQALSEEDRQNGAEEEATAMSSGPPSGEEPVKPLPVGGKAETAEPKTKNGAEDGTVTGVTGEAYDDPAPKGPAEAQTIKTNFLAHLKQRLPYVYFIKSRAELDGYVSAHSRIYDLSPFVPATERYTDAFFADKALLIVVTEESSGSISYEGVSVGDGIVSIDRYFPEVRTCDMSGRHTVIELDRDDPIFSLGAENVQVLLSE